MEMTDMRALATDFNRAMQMHGAGRLMEAQAL
ncbi:MAG: hypothetical protein JWO28_2 [Hyphomicrobiales bacterium]|nr:hypothetical protein [Hyphomicrobiales bacterium]